MKLLVSAYNLILYQPLLNALILLYQYLPGKDFGIAIILLTICIRILLYPLIVKSLRSQKILAELQPKILEIQTKYKEDKEKQVKEIIGLYQKEKINPLAGFFSFLIQLPILVALYRVFWKGLRLEEMANLYSFVPRPEIIDPTFLGIINLGRPSLVLAVLAGLSQFFQAKMSTSRFIFNKGEQRGVMAQFSKMIQKQNLYFFPIFTILILLKLPSALALYWIVTGLFSISQQYLIFKNHA